ncbi:GEVED domain-containing protein [Spirosoma endbachense]|uniref:T9SS type A sorting domain-containing protein n=1 Tax=Spirosoma endbachense TaxID=2666025 RepID=A0A6P1VXE6_9BACT|nr:GEVED domain-containing protein [Spirosoma endbachense]QHV97861.1 T9SS type A sorting domain-containing protein [Spirosoma endbachense]
MKTLFLALFACCSFSAFSQQTRLPQPCGTSISSQEVERIEKQYKALANQLRAARVTAGLTYFPVRFTFIVKSALDKNDNLLRVPHQSLEMLNRDFMPLGIQFYLTSDASVSQIINPTLVTFKDTPDNMAAILDKVPQDAINIYVANEVYDSKGKHMGGFAYLPVPGSKANLNAIVLGSDNLRLDSNGDLVRKDLVSHEMGHYFGLYHTFQDSDDSDSKKHELVNGANCLTTGDQVCDTPADPYDRLDDKNLEYTKSCKYYGTIRDANGDAYKPMTDNLMSYFLSCSSYRFTPGQNSRMKENGLPARLMTGIYTHLPVDDTPVLLSSVAFEDPTFQGGMPGSAKLVWTNGSAKQNGYIFERSEQPDSGFLPVGSTGDFYSYKPGLNTGVNTWYDVTADSRNSGKKYYYRIRAANSTKYSNVVATPSPLLIKVREGGITSNVNFPVGVSLSIENPNQVQVKPVYTNRIFTTDNTFNLAGEYNSSTTKTIWNDVPRENTSSLKYTQQNGQFTYNFSETTTRVGGSITVEKGVCFPYHNTVSYFGCGSSTNTRGIKSIKVWSSDNKKTILESQNVCSTAGTNTNYSDMAFIENTYALGNRLVRGKTHTILTEAMSVGSGSNKGTILTYKLLIWIDFNQDRLFTSDELVVSSASTSGASLSSQLKIPVGATKGLTRMRIRLNSGTNGQDPCIDYGGETEDYLVNIADSDTPESATLLVSPETKSVKGEGETGVISLTANNDWTATSSSNWIILAPLKGSAAANQPVSYTIDANTFGIQRIGTITFSAGGLVKTVLVTQEKKLQLTLSLSADSRTVAAVGTTGSFNLTTTSNWVITSNASWLRASPASGSAGSDIPISFSVDANTASTSRTGVLSVNAGGLIKTFTVTQGAAGTTKLSYCTPDQSELYNCSSDEETMGLASFKIWSTGKASVLLDSKGVCGQTSRSYSDLSSQAAIKLTRGKSFPFQVEAMLIRIGDYKDYYYKSRINIWVDLNQDGEFTNAERLYISNLKWNATFEDLVGEYPDPYFESQFSIPATAKTGQTRLRIRFGTPVYSGDQETACEELNGETEDYLVDLVDDGSTATLVLSADSRAVSAPSTTGSFSLTSTTSWSIASSASWLRVSPSSGSAGSNLAITFTIDANTASTSRTGVLSVNAGGLIKTFTVTQSAATTKLSYCTPAQSELYNCSSDEETMGLASFKIWSAGKASVLLDSKGVCGQTSRSYSDLSSQAAIKLTRGKSFPFQVEAMLIRIGDYKDYYYKSRINIWVDLNQDGEFTNAERLYISNLKWNATFEDLVGEYPDPYFESQFSIPATAKTGQTRLRIRFGTPVYSGDQETACEELNGETEDYLVDISDAGQSRLAANAQSAELMGRLKARQSNSAKELGESTAALAVTVYPNPALDKVTVHLSGNPSGAVRLVLIDASGSRLRNWSLPAAEATQRLEVDLGPLPAGVYLLEAHINGQQVTTRIVKQ